MTGIKGYCTLLICMEGKELDVIVKFRKRYLENHHPDVIAEMGINRILANEPLSFQDRDKGLLGIIVMLWKIITDLMWMRIAILSIKRKLKVSTRVHGSELFVMAAHPHCANNPYDKEKQIEQLHKAEKRLRKWGYNQPISTIWVNNDWKSIEVISDHGLPEKVTHFAHYEEEKTIKDALETIGAMAI
jgi:hypothetical protein